MSHVVVLGAPCQEDPDLWYEAEDYYGNVIRQRRLRGGLSGLEVADRCLDCDLYLRCREAARRNLEPYGIWGGESTAERAKAFGTTAAKLRGMGEEVPGRKAGARARHKAKMKAETADAKNQRKPWTPEEDALVFGGTVREAALKLGRTYGSVAFRRAALRRQAA